MIVQPQSPPQPKGKLRAWLSAEWQHLGDMTPATFAKLFLPTLIVFWFNPLVPVLAYALQLWAGRSWQWPARWGSVRMWARQGGWFVGILATFGILADAHIWFFPALVALVQTVWRDHLPGELGLLPYPLQYNNLLARLMLLLPLTPTLALLYEQIDPRTQVDPPRQLLPRDLAKPQPATPPEKPTSPPAPSPGPAAHSSEADPNAAQPQSGAAPPPSPAKKKRRDPAQATQPGTEPKPQELEQLTIDSILIPDQDQTDTQPTGTQKEKAERTRQTTERTSAQTTGTAQRKKQQSQRRNPPQARPPTEPVTEEPSSAKPPEAINWDDVAE